MPDVTTTITSILQCYMRDPAAPIQNATTLIELEIDRMDLPMISLDIEDALGVQISYTDETDNLATVQSLIACVAARLIAKTVQPNRPRVKSTWMSTGSDRRR